MKKLFIPAALMGLTVALSSCGSTPAPAASDQPTVTTISGTLVTPGSATAVSLPELASVSAATSSAGSFSLNLPEAAALAGKTQTATQVMSGLQCSGTLESKDTAAQGYLVAALNTNDNRTVYAVAGSKTGLLSRNVTGKVWLYTDRATTLSGTVDCAKLFNIGALSSIPVTVAMNAKAGWNVVDVNINASSNIFGSLSASGTAVNSTSSDAPTTWRTMPELTAQIGF